MQTVSRRHIAPWAAAAALALAPLFVPMAAHAQNGFKIVASGLNNPHGLTFGADGSLYIAEAGTGGNGASLKSGDGSIVSYGATGSVTRLLGGTQMRILTGLPSLGDQTTKPDPGAGATGLQDLAFGEDGSLYGVIGLGANTSLQARAGPNFATLVKFDTTNDSYQKIADLGAYETKNNPDGTATDSNPYSLAVLADGRFAVADAGANDVIGISADGKTLSTLAVLSNGPHYRTRQRALHLKSGRLPRRRTGAALRPDAGSRSLHDPLARPAAGPRRPSLRRATPESGPRRVSAAPLLLTFWLPRIGAGGPPSFPSGTLSLWNIQQA